MVGVLVAISIPIFTSQLEKSRDAVTLSNIRAAYAQAQTAYLTGSGEGTGETATVVVNKDSNNKITSVIVKGVEAKGQSGDIDNFDQLPFAEKASDLNAAGNMGGTAGKYNITFTYENDAISAVAAAKQ